MVFPPFNARLLLKVSVPAVPLVAGNQIVAGGHFRSHTPMPERVCRRTKTEATDAETSKTEAGLSNMIAGVLEMDPPAQSQRTAADGGRAGTGVRAGQRQFFRPEWPSATVLPPSGQGVLDGGRKG